jgi:ribosomal protein S18 acetylase RimI-like enzyme
MLGESPTPAYLLTAATCQVQPNIMASANLGVMVRVRPAQIRDAPAIAKVHVDTWRTTYHGIVTDEYLSSMSYERRQRMWETALQDPKTQSVFVAEEDQGNVVGFAACGPAREMRETFDGELYAIYVFHNAQGKGAGRRLALSVARDLKARSFDSMLVWVLEQNPFKRFYERLGGELVATKDAAVGGRDLKELGFGWRNLDSLIVDLEREIGSDPSIVL